MNGTTCQRKLIKRHLIIAVDRYYKYICFSCVQSGIYGEILFALHTLQCALTKCNPWKECSKRIITQQFRKKTPNLFSFSFHRYENCHKKTFPPTGNNEFFRVTIILSRPNKMETRSTVCSEWMTIMDNGNWSFHRIRRKRNKIPLNNFGLPEWISNL